MGTAVSQSCVTHIGHVAGIVWRTLSDQGPMTTTKLLKAVDEPRDTVMQAIGWLAREGKLEINENRRSHLVSLCENGQ
jgi:hypothetical protein